MEVRIFSKQPITGDERPAVAPDGVTQGFLIASGDIGIANPPDPLEIEILNGSWRVKGTTRGRTVVNETRKFKRVRLDARVAIYLDDASGLPVVQDPTP